MDKDLAALLTSRQSANHFDPHGALSDAQVHELLRLATTAPSAFNSQNWKFIAVRTPQEKARLKKLAYDQAKVEDAAVTFIVCGTLMLHETLPRSLEPSVGAGLIDRATYDAWIGMATDMYAGKPVFQRDEAIRSGSLAGMSLMLAAHGMGLAAGPMIGFDAEGVYEAFHLDPLDVPVMLIAVGRPAPGNWPQKPRRPVEEVLHWA